MLGQKHQKGEINDGKLHVLCQIVVLDLRTGLQNMKNESNASHNFR